MTLDLEDKKYIDDAMERNRIQFRLENQLHLEKLQQENQCFFKKLQKENRDHMTALREGFQDDIRGLAELIQERPTREEVRELIREETPEIVRSEIYLQLGPTISEISAMVKDHEKRLGRLETSRP